MIPVTNTAEYVVLFQRLLKRKRRQPDSSRSWWLLRATEPEVADIRLAMTPGSTWLCSWLGPSDAAGNGIDLFVDEAAKGLLCDARYGGQNRWPISAESILPVG